MERQTEDYNRVAVMTPATFELFFSAIDCPACKKESRRDPPRLIALGGFAVERSEDAKRGDIKWGDMPSTLMWRPYVTSNRRTL